MIYIVIGTTVLVGLLIGLTTLSVIFLARKVTNELKARSVELLSSYDFRLEEKAKEIEAKRIELENIKQTIDTKQNDNITVVDSDNSNNQVNTDFLNVIQQVGSAEYRDKEIFSLYRMIKNSFVSTNENVEKAVDLLLEDNPSNSGATSLLKELEYDTIYNLSTLPSNVQLDILKGSLGSKSKKIFDEYLKDGKKFSVLEFYDYIKESSEKENLIPTLYVSKYDINKKFTNRVNVEIDNNICEGFVIKYGNKVYDYSIKENEVV